MSLKIIIVIVIAIIVVYYFNRYIPIFSSTENAENFNNSTHKIQNFKSDTNLRTCGPAYKDFSCAESFNSCSNESLVKLYGKPSVCCENMTYDSVTMKCVI